VQEALLLEVMQALSAAPSTEVVEGLVFLNWKEAQRGIK